MREIKFRGLRQNNGTPVWEYGLYVFDVLYPSSWATHRISPDNHAVDESTIGQFTGLRDKNGVEIYEGDIISLVGASYTYVVKFEDHKFVCDHHNKPLGRWGDIYRFKELSFEIEVIGNIYQP